MCYKKPNNQIEPTPLRCEAHLQRSKGYIMKKLVVAIAAFSVAGLAGFIAYLLNLPSHKIGKYAGYAMFGTLALCYETILKWQKCPECGARIRAKALKCSQCKKELRKWYDD
jgi:hypothetical protein